MKFTRHQCFGLVATSFAVVAVGGIQNGVLAAPWPFGASADATGLPPEVATAIAQLGPREQPVVAPTEVLLAASTLEKGRTWVYTATDREAVIVQAANGSVRIAGCDGRPSPVRLCLAARRGTELSVVGVADADVTSLAIDSGGERVQASLDGGAWTAIVSVPPGAISPIAVSLVRRGVRQSAV